MCIPPSPPSMHVCGGCWFCGNPQIAEPILSLAKQRKPPMEARGGGSTNDGPQGSLMDTVPLELTQHILSFTGDSQPIAARCCWTWWKLICGTPPEQQQHEWAKQSPRLQLRSVVGSVSLLEWAKDNGCPWNESVCHAAAKHGHLEVLQWAHEHGCIDMRICILCIPFN